METFVGRDNELRELFREFELVRRTGRGRFLWIRGRRRVGKSRLVQELCNRSNASYCFYQAPRRSRLEALADFAEAVRESSLTAAEAFEGASYNSWPAALRAAAAGAQASQPAILVIDELPYLTALDEGFAADLQKAWDRTLQTSPILLVCVGSDVRMMDTLLGERSPLHGRPTREMRIEPLSPAAVAEITGAPSAAEAIDRYLIVGGLPPLASSWAPSASLREFLTEALRDDQTPFVTTALRIMASELERDLQAKKVLEAIGYGDTAHGRIQSRSGVKGNTLTAALEVLTETKRMVSRELPYAAPPGRTTATYTIRDPYLRFWLRFIGPHLGELERGRPDITTARVMRDWSAFRGRAVEPLVREGVEQLLVDTALSERLGGARHVGSWWRRDHAIEVDLVGADAPEPSRVGFIGSVKWRESEPFCSSELRNLASARAAVPGAGEAKLIVVSRSGVDRDVEADAVFGPEELLAAW
ncbi:MAG: ATP-binding protein [Solirubrobacteraceae bacterium]